jgi:cobalt/nickel transport system permease protein
MHMSDALLSPAVGGTLWAGAAAAVAVCARRVERDPDPRRVPLMGVMGAFVFAAQMVNFSIPGTGSSGHLGGSLLLAALLGPSAGLLVIASVLAVQALFFADGGLLALGANIVNMGVVPCFVAFPLVFRLVAGRPRPGLRLVAGSLAAGMLGSAMGAAAVAVETNASGISDLPLGPFLALMVPVHLAIGAVEGLATAAVLSMLWRARPDLSDRGAPARRLRPVVAGLAAAALLIGGAGCWLASTEPDGLEWAVARTAGAAIRPPLDGIRVALGHLQASIAPFPDYRPRSAPPALSAEGGASLAGVAGAALTLAVVMAAFWALRTLRRRVGAGRGGP